VPLTNGMFDALVSFSYNVGVGAFGESTLLRRLRSGDYSGAAREFDRWVHGDDNGIRRVLAGLVNRRNEEEELFKRDGLASAGIPGPPQTGTPQGDILVDNPNVVELKPYKAADIPLKLRELLVENDIGDDCYILNCALAGLGLLRLAPQPSKFTSETAEAVRLFQRREALSRIDAKVGPETKRAIENSLKRARSPVPSPIPNGNNYCRLTRTSDVDNAGLVLLKLDFVTQNGVGDSITVYSGEPGNQVFLLYTDFRSVPQSLQPIPQNRYTIGDIEFAGGTDNYTINWTDPSGDTGPKSALGPVWVGLTAQRPDDRGDFGFHLDNNRTTNNSPSSAGCVCVETKSALKKLVKLLREYNPRLLVVDWGL
jgi:lysozyme